MIALSQILPDVLQDTNLHARWLNSLSLMENTGARKIMRNEHPGKVTGIVLKHAAEEARHAYFLKKQISRLGDGLCPTYEFQYLLAPLASLQYLNRLDAFCSRLLQTELGLKCWDLHYAAYLLVTWAIEVRADELYGEYQQALSNSGSRVNVKTIIAEEAGHLREMMIQMDESLPGWKTLAESAAVRERQLYREWIFAVAEEVEKAKQVI